MPHRLTEEEAAALGCAPLHERMDNGELRFRLRFRDGSSYIRTQAGAGSGWQNSHLHRRVRELNVLQSGVMVVAELREGRLELQVLRSGDFYLCPLDVPHNSYLFPDSVAHTVKYGADLPQHDWTPCPELDPLCRAVNVEALILQQS